MIGTPYHFISNSENASEDSKKPVLYHSVTSKLIGYETMKAFPSVIWWDFEVISL